MRQIVVTQTGVGTTAPVVLDTYISPFQVGIGLKMTASADVIIQHTFDNVLDASVTPTWYSGYSTTAGDDLLLQEDGFAILQEDGSYLLTGDLNDSTTIMFPVAAIRLSASVNDGTITMTVLQAGRP